MNRLIISLTCLLMTLSLPGCSLFSLSDDNVNALELANNLLKAQQDEFGEPTKVNLPVRVNYTLTRKAEIDKKLLIEFEFITETPLPILRFALAATDGLILDDHDIEPLYEGLKAGQIIKAEATVIPQSENKYYLDVYMISELGEEKLARLLKIPVAVGAYSLSDEPVILR